MFRFRDVCHLRLFRAAVSFHPISPTFIVPGDHAMPFANKLIYIFALRHFSLMISGQPCSWPEARPMTQSNLRQKTGARAHEV